MIRRFSTLWLSVFLFGVTVPLGLPATGFSLTPQYGYVTDSATSEIYVLDLTAGTIVGQPINAGADVNLRTHGIIVSPDGNMVYAANENGQSITQIALGDKTTTVDDVVTTIDVPGDYMGGIAISPNGRYLYVAHTPAGYPFRSVLTVIDTDPPVPAEGEPDPGPFPVVTTLNLNEVSGDNLANQPFDIKVSPDGTRLYISNVQANAVYVVDTNPVLGSVALAAVIPVGNDPHGLAVSPDGLLVYVANTGDNTVSVLDPSLNELNAEIDVINNVGLSPWRIAAGPNGQNIYVTNSGENTVAAINTSDYTDITAITVGDGVDVSPQGIDVNTDGTRVYVTNKVLNESLSTLSVIQTDNSNFVTTFDVSNDLGTNLLAIAAEQEPHGVISVAKTVYVQNTPVGETLPSPQRVFVYNVGVANLFINSISTPEAPFSIVGDICTGRSVLPGGSCLFEIQFAPESNSVFRKNIVIDTDFFDATVTLEGIGTGEGDNLPPSPPKLVSPADNATGLGSTVTFTWEESSDPNQDPISYEIHYMPYVDYLATGFDGSESIAYIPTSNIVYAGMGLSSLLLFAGALRLRRNHKVMVILTVLAATVLLAACGGGGGGGGGGGAVETKVITYDVSGLTPDSYVWKVVARDTRGGVTDSAADNLFTVN